MDVPSTVAGRVVAVQIAKGAKVSSGSPVVELEPVADAGTDPTVRQPILTDAALLAAAAAADAARAAARLAPAAPARRPPRHRQPRKPG
jgi:pyruvate/2-oxoglutarate dehydrogenase complex dihydrolipoamide acyltransferase (E2) component